MQLNIDLALIPIVVLAEALTQIILIQEHKDKIIHIKMHEVMAY